MGDVKQVAVVRRDLKMRRGKENAQTGHGFLAFITKKMKLQLISHPEGEGREFIYTISLSDVEREWLESSYKKVTLQVEDEEGLLEVHQRAMAAGLEVHLVTDSGLTEFNGVPTKTCLVIGPDLSERIDPITGHLKLY